MPEKVELIERVEGHVGINVELEPQRQLRIKFGIKEGPRLFEKFLEGRTYHEVPIFVQRICGFCPIVHNLSAVKAIEQAVGINPPPVVGHLRRAFQAMELIQSHSAHLYLFTLPDFTGKHEDIFGVNREHPEIVQKAIELRKDINSMIETLGGRTVHPIASRIRGFTMLPSKDEIRKDLKRLERMKPITENTIDFFADLNYPDLEIDTHYLALGREDDRYPLYDGHVVTSKGKRFKVSRYDDIIHERTVSHSTAKFSYIEGAPYLTSALSRINLNNATLKDEAKRKLEEITISFPSDNPYHNNVAQAIEILQCIETIQQIYTNLLDEDLSKFEHLDKEFMDDSSPKVKAGTGIDAVEAPRGTLFHSYEVNDKGTIQEVDILTPTAQSAAAIEEHINVMVSELEGVSYGETTEQIKKLVRAYDPCISCSVH